MGKLLFGVSLSITIFVYAFLASKARFTRVIYTPGASDAPGVCCVARISRHFATSPSGADQAMLIPYSVNRTTFLLPANRLASILLSFVTILFKSGQLFKV